MLTRICNINVSPLAISTVIAILIWGRFFIPVVHVCFAESKHLAYTASTGSGIECFYCLLTNSFGVFPCFFGRACSIFALLAKAHLCSRTVFPRTTVFLFFHRSYTSYLLFLLLSSYFLLYHIVRNMFTHYIIYSTMTFSTKKGMIHCIKVMKYNLKLLIMCQIVNRYQKNDLLTLMKLFLACLTLS